MATREPTSPYVDVSQKGNGAVYTITWTGLLNGGVGDAVKMPEYADKSVHVFGTFGVGGSVAIEGANDAQNSANFAALRNPAHSTIALTAVGIEAVLENTTWIRPHVTAGDGTTNLTVVMQVHLPHPFRT